MQKQKTKIITWTLFSVLLFVNLLLIPSNKTFAADLEVQYPEIYGKTLSSGTKLPEYAEYLFYGGMGIGFFSIFLSFIIAGVMYLMSPAKPDLQAEAKDRVYGAISGLIILSLLYLIVVTINPQLSIFSFNEPKDNSEEISQTKNPGVYFNKSNNCSDDSIAPSRSSIEDFGETLRNKINSVSIIHDSDAQTRYLSILYDSLSFQGKCQYVFTSSGGCMAVSPFAMSASVMEYDDSPSGDGVYFYRKSCFNNQSSDDVNALVQHCNQNSGGYYKVPNSSIGSIFVSRLENLQFTGVGSAKCTVPEKEQDCVKYDKNGVCCTQKTCGESGRKCPTLSGENISSVIINGKYIVLFVYKTNEEASKGPWTYCQAFPTTKDINKIGPQQIKWQSIRNNSGVVPNYVVIFPIQN